MKATTPITDIDNLEEKWKKYETPLPPKPPQAQYCGNCRYGFPPEDEADEGKSRWCGAYGNLKSAQYSCGWWSPADELPSIPESKWPGWINPGTKFRKRETDNASLWEARLCGGMDEETAKAIDGAFPRRGI